jgi:hypothetical protein
MVNREFKESNLTTLMLEAIRCAILLAAEDGPESDIIFIDELEHLAKRIVSEKLDFSLKSRLE